MMYGCLPEWKGKENGTSGAEAGWTYDEGVRICLITTI